jgi:hypothetical protein
LKLSGLKKGRGRNRTGGGGQEPEKKTGGIGPKTRGKNSSKTQRKNPENREGRTGQEPGKKTEAGREERKQKQGRKNPEKQRKNQENASHTQRKNPDPNSKGEASTVLCSSSQGLRKQGKRKRKKRTTDREGEKGRGESQISPAIVFVPAEKEQQRTKDY